MNIYRYDNPHLFEAFIKSSQYLVRLKTQQDIWEHLAKFIMNYFPAGWTAFARWDSQKGITIHHCSLPEAIITQRLFTEEVRKTIEDVIESGFLASQIIPVPYPSMIVFLPVMEEYRTENVLLIGHNTADTIPNDLLNIYLAIASLAGATSERLQHELELNQHRTQLEKLVQERTAELARAKHQNELILHSVGEGICGLDLNGRIIFVNPSTAQMIDWNPEELIGQDAHATFHHTRPDNCDYPAKECPVYAALKHGSAKYITNENFFRKNGTSFPVEFMVTPITEGNNILGAVLVFRDITERKQAEDDLKRYASELEIANKELEAFSYSVSHDLRAPLRGIDGFSLAVLEDYGEKLDEQGKSYLNRIRKSSQLMGLLIDDMLKLSRTTRAEIHLEEVNLSEMAQSIAEELKQAQPERTAEFVIFPSVVVKGDKILLSALLRNLLENSWKFTGNIPEACIEFGTFKKNDGAVYFVKDNGAGFDMKYADKLFKPFQRLHSQTEYPGTGIGLANVFRIVRRHGGKVWAEGEQDKGATIYFTLEEKS